MAGTFGGLRRDGKGIDRGKVMHAHLLKNRRLLALLAALAFLLLMGWTPWATPPSSVIVEPVARPAIRGPTVATLAASQTALAHPPRQPVRLTWPLRASSPEIKGDPFALRLPPPSAPSVPQATAAAAVAMPPAPAPQPPPSPPPLQVIGNWNDGKTPGVFVAGPAGTMLVHPGDTLLADYRVQELGPDRLTVLHVPTNRLWHMDLPARTTSRQ